MAVLCLLIPFVIIFSGLAWARSDDPTHDEFGIPLEYDQWRG